VSRATGRLQPSRSRSVRTGLSSDTSHDAACVLRGRRDEMVAARLQPGEQSAASTRCRREPERRSASSVIPALRLSGPGARRRDIDNRGRTGAVALQATGRRISTSEERKRRPSLPEATASRGFYMERWSGRRFSDRSVWVMPSRRRRPSAHWPLQACSRALVAPKNWACGRPRRAGQSPNSQRCGWPHLISVA